MSKINDLHQEIWKEIVTSEYMTSDSDQESHVRSHLMQMRQFPQINKSQVMQLIKSANST